MASSLPGDIRGDRPAAGRPARFSQPPSKTPGITGRPACNPPPDQAATLSATSLYSSIWSKFM